MISFLNEETLSLFLGLSVLLAILSPLPEFLTRPVDKIIKDCKIKCEDDKNE